MKKGLVLEGGAMRGLFTAGVLDVMMENNIEVDAITGVSAGAAFGCNYKSRQIGRVLRYNKNYIGDKRYCSMKSLITTGDLFGADFCYNLLPEKLDVFDKETFNNNPTEFYAVCTDVETGKPIYKALNKFEKNTYDWIRGSASLPLVARVVETEGKKLLDGGLGDSIPLKFSESIGCDKNIVVLTRERGYKKEKSSLIWLVKIVLRKYPKAVEAIKKRHIMYNETTKYVFEREKEGKALVICPKEALPTKRIEKNPEVLQQVYDLGRQTALEKLEELKKF